MVSIPPHQTFARVKCFFFYYYFLFILNFFTNINVWPHRWSTKWIDKTDYRNTPKSWTKVLEVKSFFSKNLRNIHILLSNIFMYHCIYMGYDCTLTLMENKMILPQYHVLKTFWSLFLSAFPHAGETVKIQYHTESCSVKHMGC